MFVLQGYFVRRLWQKFFLKHHTISIQGAVGIAKEFALIPIDMAHVAWADDIVVFNVQQFDVVNELLDCAEMNGFERANVHIFPVEDDYSFRDPQLVQVLKELATQKFC